MKQHSCSGSLDALNPIFTPKGEKNLKKQIYSREFQAMLDGLEEEETDQSIEKKRRLSINQVNELEKNFELENKLEPEKKAKLAQELGLEPRQVAIWFQNRRARWKTKRLEKDYTFLKANYDTLKLHYNNLEQEKQNLTAELRELEAKLKEDNSEISQSVKVDSPKYPQQIKDHVFGENEDDSNGIVKEESNANAQLFISPSPSSSFQFNEYSSSFQFNEYSSLSPSSSFQFNEYSSLSPSSSFQFNEYSSSSSYSYSSNHHLFQPFDSNLIMGNMYQPQLVEVEEKQCMFSNAEDSCNIFSVDQAPTLQWYFAGQ